MVSQEARLLQPCPDESVGQEFALETYEQSLHDNGVRTGRHASEKGIAPPEDDIKQATVHIRRIIAPMFAVETEVPDDHAADVAAMKSEYWQLAGRVSTEHGAIEGYGLDDYFATTEGRSYFVLKQEIIEQNPEGSVGRQLVEAVDLYHKSLNINPAHAATIVCELIGRGRSDIGALAASHGDIAPHEATRSAFSSFLTEMVPTHITKVIEEFGTGEAVIKGLTKQSFYPEFEQCEQLPVVVDMDDIKAIIKVFDLQNRPYSRAELRMANDIAAQPAMQMAMMSVHNRLMQMSEFYLRQHPERMTGNMTSWSEIFIPETDETGTMTLLPNPKLMRAITNNILPAVSGNLLQRGAEVDELTEADIVDGVTTASRTYKLLQAKVGLFKTNPETGNVELGNVASIICPANQVLPSFLSQYLGVDYKRLADLSRAS